MSQNDIFGVFLDGAVAVAAAVADRRVAAAWAEPSVLEEQLVGGLAGHLARGGVWVVEDYLAGEVPPGPADLDSAAAYFVAFVDDGSASAHEAIRARGAALAAAGHEALIQQLRSRIASLGGSLEGVSPDRLVAVVNGRVMRVADYFATRIVEQAVHLDDLARSVGVDAFAYPGKGLDIAIEVGIEVARRRTGSPGLLRALYRRGFADGVLPVL